MKILNMAWATGAQVGRQIGKVVTASWYSIGVAMAGLMLAIPVQADTTYHYIGEPLGVRLEDYVAGGGGSPGVSGSYADCGSASVWMPCKVTVTFSMAGPLAANLDANDISATVKYFAISDGRDTLYYYNDPNNLPNPVDPEHFAVEILTFRVWTDANSSIISWDIHIRQHTYTLTDTQDPLGKQRHYVHTESHPRYDAQPGVGYEWIDEDYEDYAVITECTGRYWQVDRYVCWQHTSDEGQLRNLPGTWTIESNDTDGDGVPDDQDICAGGDDNIDSDFDEVPDFCDTCPLDYYNDSDGDGVCDTDDLCLGDDATGNSDGDALCNDSDPCWGDSNSDADGDGICDEGDLCLGDDASGNADGDGVCNDLDACVGDDATGNTDNDLFCDDLDVCDFDVENDADDDGICEIDDNCDSVANSSQLDFDDDELGDACDNDDDNDGILDNEDECPLDPNNLCIDADTDGVPDSDDVCLGTGVGEIVNDDGCSIADLAPCDSQWKNHGAYVRSVAHAANDFVELGLISLTEHDDIVAAAGNAGCGHKK